MKNIFTIILIGAFCILSLTPAIAYPIDGYSLTGISRLLYLKLIQDGKIKGEIEPAGKLKTLNEIHLNLLDDQRLDSIPQKDPELQKALESIIPNRMSSYSVALMDITPCHGEARYAAFQENDGYQPGSVGKLAIITGIFSELQRIYPYSFEARQNLLKNKRVRAGGWAMSDHHTVPLFDIEKQKLTKRTVVESDIFSLYEWADHMMSVSNNGAASVLWRELILMHVFCDSYKDITEQEAEQYFKETDRKEVTEIAMWLVNNPLRSLGITEEEWRLGSFFTHGGKSRVQSIGGSTGTPRGLMKWMYALESGRVTDRRSSLEIKRLMYVTDRRIRYAATNELDEAAVYFKSGSFYKCDKSKDANCGKYAGNVYNYMNSIAIVEQPDGTTYMVALMTNVLSKNSNWDHRRLAKDIDKMLREEI